MAYGFLRNVFEIFEKYKTSIDIITTTEVSISVTIDDFVALDKIVSELKEFCSVDVYNKQSIICVVGDFSGEKNGIVKNIFNALESLPVRMISYGGSRNNVSIVVEQRHKINALNALNSVLSG